MDQHFEHRGDQGGGYSTRTQHLKRGLVVAVALLLLGLMTGSRAFALIISVPWFLGAAVLLFGGFLGAPEPRAGEQPPPDGERSWCWEADDRVRLSRMVVAGVSGSFMFALVAGSVWFGVRGQLTWYTGSKTLLLFLVPLAWLRRSWVG